MCHLGIPTLPHVADDVGSILGRRRADRTDVGPISAQLNLRPGSICVATVATLVCGR